MPAVSIIIVSYNVKQLLMQCLESIPKHFPAEFTYEIIVVDNNSTDGSVAAVKQHFTDIILIENKFNNGFSGANNQGINKAQGEIIFLLNPDTELTNKTLLPVLNFISLNKNAIAGPRLLNTDGSFQNSCFRFPGAMQIVLESLFLNHIINIKTYPQDKLQQQCRVDALSGAALLFSRSLTVNIGKLDENLFWMEDIDFCFRCFKNNGGCNYFPGAEIMHHSGQSAKKNLNIAIANQVISKIKYLKKNSGISGYFVAIIFSYVHILSRIAIFCCFGIFSPLIFTKLKAYLFTFKQINTYLIKGSLAVA